VTWYESDPHVGETIISQKEIADRVAELAAEISEDYVGREPLLIGVLKGAFVFITDLARSIDLPVSVDFMAVSSYGTSTKSSGVVRIIKDLDTDLEGRDVIVVEDIVESGLTLNYLLHNLRSRNPRSLAICSLLYKEVAATSAIKVDYIGFSIPREFVIGYGLDTAERYRNLPFVALYSEEHA